MIDPLERVIRPIVEGQIRSFTHDHPEVVEAVNWFKPRDDKRVTFINSLAKRIVRDLLCPMSRARLEAALAGTTTWRDGQASESESLVGLTGEAELELAAGSAGDGGGNLDLPSSLNLEQRA